ncbi:hypothetical protein GQR99_05705 [Cereibacter sphaeroides]|nr:hypothetical protein GQR99_05705 [Cereibacter sphaeroides]
MMSMAGQRRILDASTTFVNSVLGGTVLPPCRPEAVEEGVDILDRDRVQPELPGARVLANAWDHAMPDQRLGLKPTAVQVLRHRSHGKRTPHAIGQTLSGHGVDRQQPVEDVRLPVRHHAGQDERAVHCPIVQAELSCEACHRVPTPHFHRFAEELRAGLDRHRVEEVLADHIADRAAILPALVVLEPLVETPEDRLGSALLAGDAWPRADDIESFPNAFGAARGEAVADRAGRVPIVLGLRRHLDSRVAKDAHAENLR